MKKVCLDAGCTVFVFEPESGDIKEYIKEKCTLVDTKEVRAGILSMANDMVMKGGTHYYAFDKVPDEIAKQLKEQKKVNEE